MSKISADREALRSSYLSVIGMIALLAAPAGVGIAAVAEPLVLVFLGPKWIDAVQPIAILGFAGAISGMETNTGATCIAVGRPDLLTRLYGFHVSILVVLMIAFTYNWGVNGAALSVL